LQKKKLIQALYDAKVFRFGEFTLASGQKSSVYIDLRQIIAYPSLLQAIAKTLFHLVKNQKFDQICGVPYTALPIATCISIQNNLPLIMLRKEAKAYGTKKLIEGQFKPNDNCLVVEDLITTGGSLLKSIAQLEEAGLTVTHSVVLLDRQQGGHETLKAKGYQCAAVFTITEIFNELKQSAKLSLAEHALVDKFLSTLDIKSSCES